MSMVPMRHLAGNHCWLKVLPDEVLAHIIEEYLGFKAHLHLMTTCKKLNLFTSSITHRIAIRLNAYLVDHSRAVDEQLFECIDRMFAIQMTKVFFYPKDTFFYVSTKLHLLVKQSKNIFKKAILYRELVLNKNWKKHLCAISKMDIQFDKLDNNVCSLSMDIAELENDLV